MPKQRNQIGDLPVEFVERLMKKGKQIMSLKELCKELVKFKKS